MKWIKFAFYLIMTLLSISFAALGIFLCYIGVVATINYFRINCPDLALFILLTISGIMGVILGMSGFFKSLDLITKK